MNREFYPVCYEASGETDGTKTAIAQIFDHAYPRTLVWIRGMEPELRARLFEVLRTMVESVIVHPLSSTIVATSARTLTHRRYFSQLV